MFKIFLLSPNFVIFSFFSVLLKFLVVHSIFWCLLSFIFNKSFCFEESILKSEFLEFYTLVSLAFISCCLVGVSARYLFLSKQESKSSSETLTSECSNNISTVDKVQASEQIVLPMDTKVVAAPLDHTSFYDVYKSIFF